MSNHAAVLLLAFVLTVLVSILIGAAAGYLARRDQATYPAAISHAAMATATTLTMVAAVTAALVALSG
ncbi:hypothetical protein [Nocardiopsis sp. FR6]|uniref:hypothetical protein n=1 Tax=Nocardiopsis sp. FR6 TaxID=2605986 RepID=UPI00135C556E|nr:hypothetical protein [Nocardiopsis sp. FR6]